MTNKQISIQIAIFLLFSLIAGGSIFALRELTSQKTPEPRISPEATETSLDAQIKPSKTITARITHYGPTGNKMASGKWPYLGAVATSDRSIPFGTKVKIMGQVYTVEDRTALWVGQKFPVPTFDIYDPVPEGMTVVDVEIL